MKRDDARNMFMFLALSLAILFGYQYFVQGPRIKQEQAAAEARARVEEAAKPAPTPENLFVAGKLPREQALSQTGRIRINTPSLRGSLSLRGAKIDDLYLTQYRETLAKDSPNVELFRPQGAEHAYYAESGFIGANVAGLPDGNSLWTVLSGDVLSVGKNVVLGYDGGTGLRFERTLSIDANYMITATDKVINETGNALTLAPYANVVRHDVPDTLGRNMILHEGAIAAFSKEDASKGYARKELKFTKWEKGDQANTKVDSTGGWMGLTDKYWLAAVIPDQSTKVHAALKATPINPEAKDKEREYIYQVGYVADALQIPAGQSVGIGYKLFAGAKRAETLRAYQQDDNIPSFDWAIDWGNFWFFTRPLFWVLDHLYKLVGNFGLAILGLTVIVKLLFFPLAHKAYESMTRMKMLQPKVEELKKRHEGNPQDMQKEMMALYQKEKINPLSGCLPILIQIPVFYSLYKVLFVTLEMRHAPFFGWIHDLSDRDPTSLFNLFGLIPYSPATVPFIGSILDGPLHIGVLPILYGLSMWLSQGMNPPTADPVQRRIFAFMPLIFTFIMSRFAVGLLIYWTWNNILTVAQQYMLMNRMGVENPIDTFFGKLARTKPNSEAAHTLEIADDVINDGIIGLPEDQPARPRKPAGTPASGSKKKRGQ